MPRDNLLPEDTAEPVDTAARQRLEAEMKRALWAQQASRSWAAYTAAEALTKSLISHRVEAAAQPVAR
jgi:hypothetical protein